MILVVKTFEDGTQSRIDFPHRLCSDNKWRSFASFGSYKSCVKVYKNLGSAVTKAKELKACVAVIPETHYVDAVGSVFCDEPAPEKQNFITIKHFTLREFITHNFEKEVECPTS